MDFTIDLKDIRISVVVPVHNKASTLAIVVEWLLSQLSLSAFYEIIFILDNCIDGSAEAIRPLSGIPNVHIIEHRDSHPSAALSRNLGIRICRGTHCLFIDADIVGSDGFGDNLKKQIARCPNDVVLGEVLGNSFSIQTWPLVMRDHIAIKDMERSELILWARSQMGLRDFRVSFLSDLEHGRFDSLHAPWVFGWSSAMAAPRKSIMALGGFCESFEQKGSEDLELSYRLFRQGASFLMVLNDPVLHLPHSRNRLSEERLDRIQEFAMLQMHQTAEVEALCAFDGAHANHMLRILACIDNELLQRIKALPFSISQWRSLGLPEQISLVVGILPQIILDTLQAKYICHPGVMPCSGGLPLFGFRLPFDDKCVESALLVGIWQHLPERLACRVFDETLRIARKVFVLKDSRLPMASIDWPIDVIAVHDAPYWERSHRISRSYFDFDIEPVGVAPPLYSFRIERDVR